MRLTVSCLVILAAFVTPAGAAAGERVIAGHGVRVRLPQDWKHVQAASPGPVTDPSTLLVVGSPGTQPRASECQIAAYRIPSDGAVVVIVGWKNIKLSGAQSQTAGRWPLRHLIRVERPSFECFSGRGASTALVLEGKAYQVNVLVGDGATRERVSEALAVARSFDVMG